MSKYVLHISDNPDNAADVVNRLGRWVRVKTASLSDDVALDDAQMYFLLIDADLSNKDTIAKLKEKRFRDSPTAADKVFLTGDNFGVEVFQANALGAVATLPREFRKEHFDKIMSSYVAPRPKSDLDGVKPEETAEALKGIESLNNAFYQAVSAGKPLPSDDVAACGDQMITNLQNETIETWLQAVRQHHSYTYRHCMIVSGIAVTFALQLGMRRGDVQRIATAALVHDIGKIKIPLEILDKPGVLSPEERQLINMHPVYGEELLREDGQYDEEVVDITLHHHELLDGSGYPDGLTAGQIRDPVRVLTVVDIFSALIDKRSYKEPIPSEKAYQILLDMGGKLDRDIVRVFEAVAMSARMPAL